MLLAALWVLALSACAPPVLRVGTSGDYPPFSVHEEGGSLHGFDVSVARAYAHDRGRELQLVPFVWPELEDRLLRDEFDVAMSGVTVRGDRLARAPMTSAVARADAVVLVPSSSGAASADLDRNGVVIAVNRGGHLETLARARFTRARLVAVDDNRSLPDLLAGGRVDAVVTDSLEAASFPVGGTEVAEVLSRDRKAYWVSPASPGLAADLNHWLGGRAASRWLDNERNVWLNDPQEPVLPVAEAALVDHIGQRLLLMPLVAEVKRARGLAVEVADREAAIEEAGRAAAARMGIDPEAYVALLRAEIEAAKEVQRWVLSTPAPEVAREALPDLGGDIRPAIDRIDQEIRRALVWAAPVRSSVEELVEALRADAPVPGLEDAALRAIARALRAIPRVKPAAS